MVFIILYVNNTTAWITKRCRQQKQIRSAAAVLAAGETRGGRDISLSRFVSAREAGRGEVFQLNADYIALSRYWKYIDSQASSPSCLLGSAPSTLPPFPPHIIVRARVESFSSRDHRNFGQQRLGDISMYHGLTERSGRFFFLSSSFSLRRLFKPSAAVGRRLARFRFQRETSAANRDGGRGGRPLGGERGKFQAGLHSRTHRAKRKRDICGRPGRNDLRCVNQVSIKCCPYGREKD